MTRLLVFCLRLGKDITGYSPLDAQDQRPGKPGNHHRRAARRLRAIKRIRRRLWSEYGAWFLIVLVMLSSNLLAAGIKDVVDARFITGKPIPSETWGINLIYAAIFFVAVAWVYLQRKTLLYPRTRELHH